MTIKKRLFWSNLLMIIVPVLIAALVGSCCVGFVFEVFKHETGFGLEDSGEFYWTSRKAAKAAVRYLEGNSKENSNNSDEDKDEEHTISSTEKLLDKSAMRMEIRANNKLIYETMALNRIMMKN